MSKMQFWKERVEWMSFIVTLWFSLWSSRSSVTPPGFLFPIKQDPGSYPHTHLFDIIVCSVVEMCWWCVPLCVCPCEQVDVKIKDRVTKPQWNYLCLMFPEFQKSFFFFHPVSGSSKGEADWGSTLISLLEETGTCRGSSVLRGFELCVWGAFIPPVPAEDTWEGWAPN